MATDKQIEANRINAQNCCGPTTPEGLARSSQNALKSGIYSQAEVTRNESRDEYEALAAAFHARFAAATPEEVSFVDALITHEWLSRRYRRADTATWEKRFDQIEEIDVAGAFYGRTEQFTKAGRLYNASRRAFGSTLKDLRQAQAERMKAEPSVTAAPAVTAAPVTEPRLTGRSDTRIHSSQTTCPRIGFVPSVRIRRTAHPGSNLAPNREKHAGGSARGSLNHENHLQRTVV